MNKGIFNIALVKAATAKFAVEQGYVEVDEASLSDLAKRVREIAAGMSGYGPKVCELAAAITGENIPAVGVKSTAVPLVAGVMLVPVERNPNQHDYPMDKPALVVEDGCNTCVRFNGTRGNSLTNDRRYVRPATEAEIDAWFAA